MKIHHAGRTLEACREDTESEEEAQEAYADDVALWKIKCNPRPGFPQ